MDVLSEEGIRGLNKKLALLIAMWTDVAESWHDAAKERQNTNKV